MGEKGKNGKKWRKRDKKGRKEPKKERGKTLQANKRSPSIFLLNLPHHEDKMEAGTPPGGRERKGDVWCFAEKRGFLRGRDRCCLSVGYPGFQMAF
jgi:hypothetical protein